MTLGVYYDEQDGQLYPVWLLVPILSSEDYLTISLHAPFERIEDIHDSMSLISVTMNALSKKSQHTSEITVHLPTVYHELNQLGTNPSSFEAPLLLIQMVDIEELLQFEVRRFFQNE